MNFEQLANELILEFFQYLKSVHLLRAFSHLNSRFNNLLINHFQIHGLDFQSISKHDFDTVCRQNLPSIANHITALRLSDDDDTPQQLDLFLSDAYGLHRFVQLKSLSLYHLSSNEIIKKVVLQFRHLPLLTHFSLVNCHLTYHAKTLRDVLNHIWRLSKLTHCHLDLHFKYEYQFSIPTIRSKSIEHLCIKNIVLDYVQLVRLFRCTPNLRHLTAGIEKLSNDQQFPFVITSLSSLKLVVDHLTHGTITMLQNMCNLTDLTLKTGGHNMNGHSWRQLIVDHLPNLKKFQFLMFYLGNNEEEIDEVLDSYRTPFWLVDHRWFVRCQWESNAGKMLIYLYTLPYAFRLYACIFRNSNARTKSTCPQEDDYWSYDHVTTLIQHYPASNDLFLSHIRFNNIQHLEVIFPLADRFLSVLPRLDRLTSLEVSSKAKIDGDIALSQLQMLIDRAPRLYLLTIAFWSSSSTQHIPLHITSNSIRRLDFQSFHYQTRDRCFNSELCSKFLRTPLAKQCEVLQIVVDNRANIDNLINGMTHLQALKVMYQPPQRDRYVPSEEELIRMMTSGYSRTSTENLPGTELTRLWIR